MGKENSDSKGEVRMKQCSIEIDGTVFQVSICDDGSGGTVSVWEPDMVQNPKVCIINASGNVAFGGEGQDFAAQCRAAYKEACELNRIQPLGQVVELDG